MSKIISFIILTSHLLVISFQSMPVLEYVTNYKYISQELCENKDKPELECNGKCYLYKKTRALQEEQEEKEAVISEILNLQYTTSEAFSYELISIINTEEIAVFPYFERKYLAFQKRITPPPKSIV